MYSVDAVFKIIINLSYCVTLSLVFFYTVCSNNKSNNNIFLQWRQFESIAHLITSLAIHYATLYTTLHTCPLKETKDPCQVGLGLPGVPGGPKAPLSPL